MSKEIIYRQGHLTDLATLQQLFLDTISSVCIADYNRQQIEAWLSGVENKQRWNAMIREQMVLVAQCENEIVGFATLTKEGHLDFFYVHKDYQRMGIAHKLYNSLEKYALQDNLKELTSDVSKTARPFFEKVGFTVIKAQIVNIKGVALTNYKMRKAIN